MEKLLDDVLDLIEGKAETHVTPKARLSYYGMTGGSASRCWVLTWHHANHEHAIERDSPEELLDFVRVWNPNDKPPEKKLVPSSGCSAKKKRSEAY
jgi:hypothetical protein